MEIYLFIYFFIIVVNLFRIKFDKNTIKILYYITFIFFVIFIGFRYKVGGDWGSYLFAYKALGFNNILLNILAWSPSYVILEYISKSLNLGIWGVNILCAIIFLYGFFYFIKTFHINKKENVVIYNPKKGNAFTKKLISSVPNIKFIPIINMRRQEVADLLSKAKVYIDFGNHPGKDRIPREAAISGCCVITGKNGSAKFYEDVPIKSEFKYDAKVQNIPLIIKKIESCFENYELESKKFEDYREMIKKERSKFIEDIKNIFRVAE